MSMENLTRADALAYRDAVIAREPARLAHLADWVDATGGPLDGLYLFRGPDQGIEEPHILRPLPIKELTTTLTHLGFTLTNEGKDDETQTWHHINHDGILTIEAEITSTRSKLDPRIKPRLLAVQFHEAPTEPATIAVAGTLTALAAKLKARLTNSDEADIHD